MFGKHFKLNEQTMSIVEEIGQHMSGGFYIYKAAPPRGDPFRQPGRAGHFRL
jgi:hypothetical protein